MAITIRVFDAPNNRYFTVTVDLATSVLSYVNGVITDMTPDYYLKIITSMTKSDDTAFPKFLVRSLADYAPGFGAVDNFTDLINNYVDYFIYYAEVGMSSSSSTSSSSSSSSHSSASSSSFSSYSSSSHSSDSSSSSSSSSPSSESNSSPSSSSPSSASSSSLSSESSSSSSSGTMSD